MFDCDAQRFTFNELWRPHITGAIAHSHFVDLLGVVSEADPLVVNLDLFAGLKVVVRDHLVASAQQNLTHLYWREPTYVYVSNGPAIIEHGYISQVLRRSREVIDAGRRHGVGMFLQQMIQNREVMDSQI